MQPEPECRTPAASEIVPPPCQTPPAPPVPEPVTALALWPTFLRRTLAEEALARAG